MIEPLTLSVEVACPVEHAFQVWTSRISQWWPADHTVSGENGVDVVLEITFVGLGDTTRVDIVHRGWDRLGAQGQQWRDANNGGWTSLLPHFVKAVRLTVSTGSE